MRTSSPPVPDARTAPAYATQVPPEMGTTASGGARASLVSDVLGSGLLAIGHGAFPHDGLAFSANSASYWRSPGVPNPLSPSRLAAPHFPATKLTPPRWRATTSASIMSDKGSEQDVLRNAAEAVVKSQEAGATKQVRLCCDPSRPPFPSLCRTPFHRYGRQRGPRARGPQERTLSRSAVQSSPTIVKFHANNAFWSTGRPSLAMSLTRIGATRNTTRQS